MIKTEIGLKKFVFRVCHVKKKRKGTANVNKTNHEQFYSTWSQRF